METSQILARYRPPDVQMTIPGSGVEPIKIGRCVICGRVIRNPVWVELGVGPTCAIKHLDIVMALMSMKIDRIRANGGTNQ